MFITCFFDNTAVFDCNINLFKQLNILYNNQVDNSICLNFAQNVVNKLALSFFTVCKRTVYIYSNNNNFNINNLKNTLISCCINELCQAFSR